jgi:tetratricopeptide (TPR) repeat protein
MAQFKILFLCAALLTASACSQPGIRASQPADVQTQAAVDAQAERSAEVAGQRGAIGVAQSTYLDLARQTQDPRVARRAVEVSMFARNQPGALEAARLWAASDADSERARQTLAALLLSEGQMEEVEPILRTMLQSNTANGFLHLSALMGKLRDTQAALALVERLAADHPSLPEAQFAIAQAAAAAGRFDTAITALERADALRRAQLLGKTSNADAIHFMRDFLVRHPDARDVRLGYARALVNANQFADARTEFTRLTTDFPQNAEISLAAGLLSFQMGDHTTARDLLTQTLEFSPRDADIVQYYLGQVAEQMKQPEAAVAHYNEVQSGNYLVPARARQAALLARAGRSDEARALLAATRGENDAQNVRLIQAQAELLRESKASDAVYDMLSEGLKRFPDSAELLYDRAMAAEKLGKLDVLEADLRRVIVLRPDDAQAYNALGYTLADRTDRLAEAIVLLDKALALAPEDPFILDSVGWAQYRSGNLARAQEYLERAYKVRPDPEIAAHLGEVLWARGQRDEAGKLWQSSLHVHPQNELLLETLRRHAH